MERYLPTDQWRHHPKDCYEQVFKRAKGRGWSMEYYSDHQCFRLFCPTRECNAKVYSSPSSAETKAKELGKTVTRCMHGNTAEVDDLERATELLDKAERLIDAIERLRESDQVYQRALGAEAELEDTETSADLEELLAEAMQLEAQATELLGEEPAEPRTEILEKAAALASTARGLLLQLPDTNADVKVQRKRLRDLRVRIARVRKITGFS